MGLLDSVRKFHDGFRESLDEARRESQIAAYKRSMSTDEYVTMTIMGAGELEKMTRAGWELVRQVPAGDHNFLKEVMPAEFLIRKGREELRRSLDL